jgi:DNA-binding NtrC family response regulator
MTGGGPMTGIDAESFALFAQSVENARPNVMLIGAAAAASRLIGALRGELRQRIADGRAAEPESWRRDGGSTLLHDVEALDPDQQRHMIEWLNRQPNRTHLIVAVGRSLYPEVKRGRFLETLFYRLNAVQLRLP